MKEDAHFRFPGKVRSMQLGLQYAGVMGRRHSFQERPLQKARPGGGQSSHHSNGTGEGSKRGDKPRLLPPLEPNKHMRVPLLLAAQGQKKVWSLAFGKEQVTGREG